MRLVGIILIVLGLIGVIWGGVTWTRRRDTVSVGPISATVQQKQTFPISPVAGGIALVVGIAMVAASGRRRA
jgi:hypothetical protein